MPERLQSADPRGEQLALQRFDELHACPIMLI